MEDIFTVQGIILASITAIVCAAGFVVGTRKRLAREAQERNEQGDMK